ncbi:MAG: hypothetical protein ABFS22_06660 [Pseudomonadota bacterium]
MKRIIFVPGKNLKPPPEAYHHQLQRCLLHGVARHDPAAADEIREQGAFSLVAWNYTYYHQYRDIAQDIPWIDKLLARSSHDENDIRDIRQMRYLLAKFLYNTGDVLPWLIPLIPDQRIKSSIVETRHYFENRNNIACRIRDLQKAPLREAVASDDRVLLIGHSLGSVIAYDSLWELHHLENITRCIDCLLTIGSPLGLRFVQRRLLGHDKPESQRYPGNIRRWVNISSHGDLVALDKTLNNDYPAMLKAHCLDHIEDHHEGIFNYYRDDRGLNVHKSYGYLVNPEVGKLIAEWWQQA